MSPPQHDMRASLRPVRSDFASVERSYALRRRMTVAVLIMVVGGTVYGLWGHRTRNPADIPTIHAEGVYKHAPENPGGIDIPHQDVRVYDELENKSGNAAPQPEHLLPPPEQPKDIPPPVTAKDTLAPLAPVPDSTPSPPLSPPPEPAPQALAPVAPSPVPAPVAAVQPLTPLDQTAKPVATTVAPVPVAHTHAQTALVQVTKPAPVKNLSIEDVLKETQSSTSEAPPAVASPPASVTATPEKTTTESGSFVIQLASSTDQAKAQAMRDDLQSRFGSKLGPAMLRLARADLGSRGVYYRIQSQGVSESEANRICASVKAAKGGCIIVRK